VRMFRSLIRLAAGACRRPASVAVEDRDYLRIKRLRQRTEAALGVARADYRRMVGMGKDYSG
jgi:hypothetical protein